MKTVVVILTVVLAILHHDLWWWDDPTLVLGFMPIGLAWHALFSCLAAALWAFAVKFTWPSEWEAWAETATDAPAGSTDHADAHADKGSASA